MQRQRDEGCVLQIDTVAESPGLHPDSGRNAGSFDELERFNEFVECFEQFFLRQPGRGNEACLMFEEFNEEKTRRVEDYFRRREQAHREITATSGERAEGDVRVHHDPHGFTLPVERSASGFSPAGLP